jgi:hypothetical protein
VRPPAEARRRGSAVGRAGRTAVGLVTGGRGEYPHGIRKGEGVGGGGGWVDGAAAR